MEEEDEEHASCFGAMHNNHSNIMVRTSSAMASLQEQFTRESREERPEEPADISAVDSMGYTALHHAARYGWVSAMKTLLNANADAAVKDKYGQTPLHLAALEGRHDIRAGKDQIQCIEALIDCGCDRDPIVSTQVEAQIKAGVNRENARRNVIYSTGLQWKGVNAVNHDGKTPLHLAARQGRAAVIEYLLTNGADEKIQDNAGDTPREHAKFYGCTDAYDEAVKGLKAYHMNWVLNNMSEESVEKQQAKLDEMTLSQAITPEQRATAVLAINMRQSMRLTFLRTSLNYESSGIDMD